MSDQRTLFFDNSLVALHSFSFTQKIKDRSSLLSARSMYKSDVPSSDYYIEIVKGYLCLALNRHIVFIRMGTQRICVKSVEACDVCKCEN